MKFYTILIFVTLPFFLSAESPRVDLIYPNGNEAYFSNTENTIYWTGDSSETVSLYFQTDSEEEWVLIAENVSGNQYIWIAPEHTSKSYKIKIERLIENENLGIEHNSTYASERGAGLFRVFETEDNNFMLAGTIPYSGGDVETYYGYTDVWLIKVNKNGELLWQKTYGTTGTDVFSNMIQLEDHGYLIAATADSADIDATKSAGSRDVLLIRTDKNGEKIWSKSFGGYLGEKIYSLTIDNDGNFLACGTTSSNSGDFARDVGSKDDAFIMKITPQGDLIWTKYLVGDMWEELIRIFPTDEGYTVIGHTNSTNGVFERESSNKDIFIIKLDNEWNTIKVKYIGGNSNERVFGAAMSDDKTLYISGFTLSNDMDFVNKKVDYAGFVGSLSNDLEINWLNTYGGSGSSRFGDVFLNNDGTLSAIGGTSANDGDITENKGGEDAWYINLDLSGKTIWSKTYGGTGEDSFHSVCQTNHNYICGATGSIDYDLSSRSDYGNKAWLATMTKGEFVKIDTSDNNFAVLPQPISNITITSPSASNKYNAKDTVYIEWVGNESEFVNILYSSNNGSDWVTIKDSVTGNKYAWFPKEISVDNYIIKIEEQVKVFEETDIEWDRNYSPGSSYDFLSIESYGNGIIVVAKTDRFGQDKKSAERGEEDIWVFELDSLGRIIWQNTFGGNKTDRVSEIIKTKDKNYLMVGSTKSDSHGLQNEGEEDYWVVKFDRKGNEIFSRSFGGNNADSAKSVIELDDGYLIYGTMRSDTNKYVEVPRWAIYNWVLKINHSGDIIDSKLEEIGNINYNATLLQKDSTTIQVFGDPKSFLSENGDPIRYIGFYCSRFDNNWNEISKKKLINNEIVRTKFAFNDEGNSTSIVALTSSIHNRDHKVYLYKINDNDQLTDSVKIENFDVNNIQSVSRASDLGYYIAYQTKADSSSSNLAYGLLGIAKIDENGKLLWKNKYGGSYWDGDPIVNVLNDGSFVLIGNCRSYDGDVSRNHFSKRSDYKNGKYATWIIKFRKTHYTVNTETDIKFGDEQEEISFDFLVYPNVTAGEIKIKVKLKEELNSTIKLYDNLGRSIETLYEGSLSTSEEIIDYSTKPLAPGRYYISLKTPEFESTQILEVVK